MAVTPETTRDQLRMRLAELGSSIRDEVLTHRDRHGTAGMEDVVGRVEADVVYAVDKVSEDRVLAWFAAHWPTDEPVRLVMEGIEDHQLVTFPAAADPADVQWVCVVDPIDGTRNLMYDKRPAWVLAALAPATLDDDGWPSATLAAIEVAAMTEIPTTKQWRADQLSVVRGGGPDGIVAEAVDVRSRSRSPIRVSPSRATSFEHGFASFAHYFPDAKALLATIEQDLWDELMPPTGEARPIFEDQYICSGGQLYEVMAGRDRLVGDLRPLALAHIGMAGSLACHPYDVATALIAQEAGVVFEDPRGGPVDAPIDTTTAVTWIAYANEELAEQVRPVLRRLLARHLDIAT